MTVLTYPECAQVTGRLVRTVNIQVKWAAAHPGQDRRLPGVVTHSRPWRAPARSWVGTTKVAPESLSTGSPAGRTLLLSMWGDGSMYSQVYVRALRRSLRDGPVERAELRRRRSLRMERWSPLGALGRRPCVVQEPEDHKRSKNGWYTHPWQRTTLLSDKAVQVSTAQVYVFSDSAVCLGKMNQHPEATDAWKKKIEWCTDALNIVSWTESTESQWNSSGHFPRIHNITDPRWDSEKWCTKCSMNLCSSQVESSSCQCTMTLYVEIKKTRNYVLRILSLWQDMQKDSFTDIGHFYDLEQKRNGTGEGDDVAEHMLLNFSESGHPVFRGTSALWRGTLRSKGGGQLSTHFCGDP